MSMMYKYFFEHFSHPNHPLSLYKKERKPWNARRCQICGDFKECGYWKQEEEESSNSSKLVYGCRECQFMIHLECAELPQELIHAFHPQHPLSLFNSTWYDFWCHACNERSKDLQYIYLCSDTNCKFNLDLGCIQLQPNNLINRNTNDDDDDQLFSHHHPLFACNQPPIGFKSRCSFCCGQFSKTDLIYVCIDCKHLYHKSCVLPQEIKHPLHLEHPPLVFVDDPGYNSYSCNACSKALATTSFFNCSVCEFKIDISCARLKPTCRRNSAETDHDHPHDLIQCDPIKLKRQPSCSRCESPIKDSVYVCLECGILLHKSCTLLPEITTPFHPLHTLTLVNSTNKKCYQRCIVCHCTPKPLQFECRKCNFVMDVRCAASVKPYVMVNTKMHQHSLAFMIKKPHWIDSDIECVTCNDPCEKYYFICPECDKCIHLECCRLLPRVVKHDSHCDPLVFTDYRIKDASDEDSEGEGVEFYCHACEDLRDLDDPTYYCQQCHFVAHLQCVFPAIVKALEEAEPSSSDFKDLF